ncbi:hypothetical protein [Aeromonas enteropelogenes]|uniref:hypothetical protein n=1 Tax=Aeromonas enteropelogenes TaxID=29489 RepID=UPI003F7446B0
MSAWEHLSEQTKDVYRQLGTRNEKEINKIKSSHIRKAIRESMFVGYDEGSPYEWLKFEYERRNKRLAAIVGFGSIVATIVGLLGGFIG